MGGVGGEDVQHMCISKLGNCPSVYNVGNIIILKISFEIKQFSADSNRGDNYPDIILKSVHPNMKRNIQQVIINMCLRRNPEEEKNRLSCRILHLLPKQDGAHTGAKALCGITDSMLTQVNLDSRI